MALCLFRQNNSFLFPLEKIRNKAPSSGYCHRLNALLRAPKINARRRHRYNSNFIDIQAKLFATCDLHSFNDN